jgi:hypothetical protein
MSTGQQCGGKGGEANEAFFLASSPTAKAGFFLTKPEK